MLGLPIDRLALHVLADLIDTAQWHEGNYLLGVEQELGPQAARAVAEATNWLRNRGLIALDPRQVTAPLAIFVTRAGHRVNAQGAAEVIAAESLQGGLHPQIEAKARPQFLMGAYEEGVVAAMKAVEVRVRDLAGFGPDKHGVGLMNDAFRDVNGPLTDSDLPTAEQSGVRFLFAGAYAVFRNPPSHREVDFDDPIEAAEMVRTASLLMRMLDRTEARLAAAVPGGD